MIPTMTRRMMALSMICALAACGRSDADPELNEDAAGPPVSETVGGESLAMWDVRFDDPSADASGFQISEQAGGVWTIKTGPSGSAVTWRAQDMVEGGSFQAGATMVEHSAPADHREGYGLIVGGRNLQAPDQRYTYFLVRGTGHYLIKRREGDATPTLVDWTPAPAVAKVVNAGDVTRNTLQIRVELDSTRFFVNGTRVETLPTDQVQPHGLVGLRINHGLDMRVIDFGVEPAGAANAAQPTEPAAPR